MRIAVIGAGWAGLAAAVAATEAGHQVTVLEAARTLGGRARALDFRSVPGAASDMPLRLDNGQHILIGAYTACLGLMQKLGVSLEQAFVRTPLALVFPDGSGLRMPDAPPPWDAAWGIATAQGWSLGERLALLRTAARWRLQGFQCAEHLTVGDLCAPLPQTLVDGFIDPLCVSALNTPARSASAQVFLRVLHDSLFAGRGGSHLLIPRTDLSALLPDAAERWLVQRGATVRRGARVQQLAPLGEGWLVDGEAFDQAVLAAPATEAARLVQTALPYLTTATHSAAATWRQKAAALQFTAIATVYAQVPAPPTATATATATGSTLSRPMQALWPGAGGPAQFAFDRGQLGGPPGLLALVVSAAEGDRQALEAAAVHQARKQLNLPALHPLTTVVEKRATFACTPGLQRPAPTIAPGLWACCDYVDGPYPATLEGAVRSANDLFPGLSDRR